MKISLLTYGFLSLCFFLSPSHAIYIGTIKITHHQAKESTTMEVKVFSDDLQNALKNEYQLDYLPKISTICNDADHNLNRYFDKHLQVWVNDQQLPFQLVDCTVVNDVHLLHFTFDASSKWQTVKVKANFFMELFPAQTNVLQVSYEGIKSSTSIPQFGRMTLGQETLELSF